MTLNVPAMETNQKCCGGLGLFGKCGRGTKKPCSGLHCKCMNLKGDCPNMHYVDCYEHYIHVEHVEDKPYTRPESTITGHPQEEKEWAEIAERYGLSAKAKLMVGGYWTQQKHLSYQAGLKFAIDFIASREGWEETKDFYLKSLTSELDKEVN